MFEDLFIVQPGVFWAKGAEAADILHNVADNAFAAGHTAGVRDAVVNGLAVVGAAAVTYGGVVAYRRYQRRREAQQA